ncbi:MAG: hypothetical protein NC206_09535 [Bacteroides sp.]|nr:hypothetical protein [Roseburia sp.]MCM1347310.1 hypothetical protein [Bacteroides sp.]
MQILSRTALEITIVSRIFRCVAGSHICICANANGLTKIPGRYSATASTLPNTRVQAQYGVRGFLKTTVESTTIPIVTVARINGVNSRSFTKLYKDKLNGFREWKQLDHAEEYVLHDSNIGEGLSIDETTPATGKHTQLSPTRRPRGAKAHWSP